MPSITEKIQPITLNIRALREAQNLTLDRIAASMGTTKATVSKLERGEQQLTTFWLSKFASALGVSVTDLISQEPPPITENTSTRPNAIITNQVTAESTRTIPVYGQAIGGDDGNFIFNGNHIADVPAPPFLRDVRDAYAVYVVGESMEPRYYAGELVYLNPGLPVKRNDFVVVQVHKDEAAPPEGYIKRFIKATNDELVCGQFNPPKEIRFPRSQVSSVHRIVGSKEL